MTRRRPLSVHVLDVGHGDSLVIEFPDGDAFAVVDCNTFPPTNRLAADDSKSEPKALSFFRGLVDEGRRPVIEFVCLTHPHADHYRGFSTLLEGLASLGCVVKEFWDFGPSAQVAQALGRAARDADDEAQFHELTYHAGELARLSILRDALEDNGCRTHVLRRPEQAVWRGHGVEVDVIAPHPPYWRNYDYHLRISESERSAYADLNPHVKDHNTVSSALLLKYGKYRILLAGDVTNETWTALFRSPNPPALSCRAVKVSHHGSAEGNFPAHGPLCRLLAGWRGRLSAAISGGYRSQLPHPNTIKTLRSHGCHIFCTGPIVRAGEEKLEPYAPPDAPPQIAAYFKLIARQNPAAPLNGDGDIVVHGYPNGRCRVVTELRPTPAWWRRFLDWLLNR